MTTKCQQLSLKDVYTDCQDMFLDQDPTFFQLLEQHIDIDEFIPPSFITAFYLRLGRNRDYPLTGSFSPHTTENISHPHRFTAYHTSINLQGAPEFLRFFQSA